MSWGGFKLTVVSSSIAKTATELNILMRPGTSYPILPPTRDRTVEIPGRDGLYYFGADVGARRFTIPCAFIYASNLTELNTHAKELGDFLTASGKPQKMKLEFENDGTRYFHVYYSGMLDLSRSVFDGEFDLPLMAPDPAAQTP